MGLYTGVLGGGAQRNAGPAPIPAGVQSVSGRVPRDNTAEAKTARAIIKVLDTFIMDWERVGYLIAHNALPIRHAFVSLAVGFYKAEARKVQVGLFDSTDEAFAKTNKVIYDFMEP